MPLDSATLDAISRHLYDQHAVNGIKYQSSLIAVLGDARAAADRDGNGEVRPDRRSQSWLAATAYLALLDQVGTSFAIVGVGVAGPTPIHHALKTFSHVQDESTTEALYALRCALLHDYSLVNVDRSGKHPMRTHLFRLTADATSPLVQMPTSPWDGRYERFGPTREHETSVNLRKVGDLAEQVVVRLRTEHEAERLGIRLELAEFELRYGMYFRIPSSSS